MRLDRVREAIQIYIKRQMREIPGVGLKSVHFPGETALRCLKSINTDACADVEEYIAAPFFHFREEIGADVILIAAVQANLAIDLVVIIEEI